MSLDLAYDDGQLAIQDTLRSFCHEQLESREARDAGSSWDASLWSGLGKLGVFGLGLPGDDSGALEVAAAFEVLGHFSFPGPLVETRLALQLLSESERGPYIDGRKMASAGELPLLPFGAEAECCFAISDCEVARVQWEGDPESVEMLSGEPWARGTTREEERCERAASGEALCAMDAAYAASLAGAGRRLISDSARYAATRRQFGRPIGEFQAVAHTLADASVRVGGAEQLARAAAATFDLEGAEAAVAIAAAARLSSRAAALDALHVAHQVFGALGITVEGPVFRVSRRIRQLASQPIRQKRAEALVLGSLEGAS